MITVNAHILHMTDRTSGPILGFTRPPILLLGSGISRRYCRNAPGWEELLDRVGARFGLSTKDMVPLKSDAARNDDGTGQMPRLATELQIELNRRLRSREVRIEDVLDDREMGLYGTPSADAIKIMAATECSGLKVDDDSPLSEEIGLFRTLSDIVPCVVTTNYDTIIEDGLFGGRFKVYSRVSDYYLSGSQGIGEVYKIHGTCTDPSTMVLDPDDYRRFRQRGMIVSAKILSVLCDYPMVIMGYGAKDPDVLEILYNLIASLDDDKLREVERNIVFIRYDPDGAGIEELTMRLEYGGRDMSFRSYWMDDFTPVLREIASMDASVSPTIIRRIRQVVRKIQVTEGSGGCRYKAIGVDDITKGDADRLVVAITDRENLKVMESMPQLSVDSMIRDILGTQSPESDPATMVRLFSVYGPQMYRSGEYVPIFYYINEVGGLPDPCPAYLRDYIGFKDRQFRDKIGTIRLPKALEGSPLDTLDDVLAAIDESADYLKPLIVIHLLADGRMGVEDATVCLRHIYENMSPDRMSSNMRCAVTYVEYCRFRKQGD